MNYNYFLFISNREYKRRTLIDRKDLLVKMKTPGLNEDDDDDDEDVRKLKQQQMPSKGRSFIINDNDDEQNLISTNNENKTSLDSQLSNQINLRDTTFDLLSDSSSSTADDETAHISELYANVGDRIDGKHRIKIKGDEIKIKGYSNKQRSKITDRNFFQSNNTDLDLRNSNGEPDLTSFDFLNEYDEKS